MRIEFESFSINVQFPEDVRHQAMDDFLDRVYDLMEDSGNYVDFRANLADGSAEFVFPLGEPTDMLRQTRVLREAIDAAQEES